ncbi:MAG: hypothetical protein CL878_13975 [Dehalococcoidia bacterium]|nr:hypothetical protein [Dehalococcoidia bacterium]
MTAPVELPPEWQRGECESIAAERTIPYAVHVPGGAADGGRYAVLFVLHGLGGDEAHWPLRCPTLLPTLAESGLNLIVVSPGVGPTFYMRTPRGDLETAIARDLVRHIDSTLPTIDDPAARALMGFSMGGFGSLYLSLRHPGVFGAAAAFSGALHIGHRTDNLPPQAVPLVEPSPARRLENDIFHQVAAAPRELLDALRWWNAVGTEDNLVSINRAFHHFLLAHRVSHEFVEGRGTHSFEFIETQIPAAVDFIRGALLSAQ